jgi:hypothetical protein
MWFPAEASNIVFNKFGAVQSCNASDPQLIRKSSEIASFLADDQSEERICEWCHNSFPENEMIETEFGYLCGDCFRERMAAEDRENNG